MTRITLVVFVKVQEKYVLLFFYSNNNDKLKSKKGTETKNPVSCEKQNDVYTETYLENPIQRYVLYYTTFFKREKRHIKKKTLGYQSESQNTTQGQQLVERKHSILGTEEQNYLRIYKFDIPEWVYSRDVMWEQKKKSIKIHVFS